MALGGDVDQVAAIALAASWSWEIESDLPAVLISGLENGVYGREYLVELDRKLMEFVANRRSGLIKRVNKKAKPLVFVRVGDGKLVVSNLHFTAARFNGVLSMSSENSRSTNNTRLKKIFSRLRCYLNVGFLG